MQPLKQRDINLGIGAQIGMSGEDQKTGNGEGGDG